MEQIITIVEGNYSKDFDQYKNVLEGYFRSLFKKTNYVDLFSEYSLKRLRQKEVDNKFLFILKTFVDQCPEHALEKCGNNFVQLLIRNGSEDIQLLTVITNLIGKLVSAISKSGFKKELDSKAIEKTIEFCINFTTESCLWESLDCIETVLRSYPEHCSFVWQKVYRHFMQFVDTTDEDISNKLGGCLFHLYQVKGCYTGFAKGGNLENSWLQYQNQLIGSLYDTVNQITEEDVFFDLKLKDTKLDLVITVKKPILCQRLRNLLNYLGTALVEPSPAAKPIHAGKIVEFVCRLIEGNSILIGNKTMEKDVTIGPFIPEIKMSLLTILKYLIIVIGSNALLFGKSISNVLYLALKRSSENRLYKNLKPHIYDVILEWVSTARSGTFVMNLIDRTVEEIVSDMEKFDQDIEAKRNAQHQFRLTSQKSSKKRKRNQADAASQSTEVTITSLKENCFTVSKALNCLKIILHVAGHTLSATNHNQLLRTLHVFAKKSVESAMWDLELFNSEYDLHKDICEVLIIFNKSSHHLHKSSINFTLELLSLHKSGAPQNRDLCQRFANDLETIFHFPRTPFQMVNPTSALMQEIEVEERASKPEIEINDSEEDNDIQIVSSPKLPRLVADFDESLISSTVHVTIPEKTTFQNEVIRNSEETKEKATPATGNEPDNVETLSSENEDEVMEVVDIESEEEDAIPEPPARRPLKLDSRAISKEVEPQHPDSHINEEAIESVNDIISEFVDELL